MMTLSKKLLITLMLGVSLSTQALNLGPGQVDVKVGIFKSTQGTSQNIAVQGLIGDHYSVTDKSNTKGLFGLGYFIPGFKKENVSVDFGMDAFYLAETSVAGNIFVEQQFENLGYRYDVRHIPVLFSAKVKIEKPSSKFGVMLSGGVGPDFSKTSGYKESSLDNGFTIPRNSFLGKSEIRLSASAGIGLQVKNVIGTRPVECGYRFFYLGKSSFNKNIAIISNNLTTGNNYAHALTCSVSV